MTLVTRTGDLRHRAIVGAKSEMRVYAHMKFCREEVVMGGALAVNLKSRIVKSTHEAEPQRSSSDSTSRRDLPEKRAYDANALLNSFSVVPSKLMEYESKENIFTQGDPASSVLCIREGHVKVAVVDEIGNEAVLAFLGPGDILGEACLAGHTHRASTATAITPSTIMVIEKPEMIRALHALREVADQFIAYTVARQIRGEKNLVDQILNFSEKRLARTLVLLSRRSRLNGPENMLPKISQETLAEMVGTTRSRVNRFMNKFRKLGFIEYDCRMRRLQINESLQSVLQE